MEILINSEIHILQAIPDGGIKEQAAEQMPNCSQSSRCYVLED